MKKLLILTLALALSLSLAACTTAKQSMPSISEPTPPPASSEEMSSEAPSSAAEPEAPVSSDAAQDSAPKPAGTSAVSENLFDNQFEMNGTLITLPTPVKTFEPFGLGMQPSKKDFMLNPNTTTSGRIESADEAQKIFVGFYNLGSEVIKLGDSMISSVNIQAKYFEDTSFTFCKGITFGSTIDEVKAAFGEPSTVSEGDPAAKVLRERLKYKNPDVFSNFYEFSFEDKKLVGIDIYVDEQ